MSYRISMPIVIDDDRPSPRLGMRRPSTPLFDFMLHYFNQYVGREVYRKRMMDDIIDAGYDNVNTIDTYRSYFTTAGYLMIVDRGEYHVLKQIPSMILADLKWEAEIKRKEERGEIRTKKMYVKPASFIKKDEFNV